MPGFAALHTSYGWLRFLHRLVDGAGAAEPGKVLAVHGTVRPSSAGRDLHPVLPPIRGNSSAGSSGGTALLLSAADDACVVVGNAVDHPDPAVEMLLIYTVAQAPINPGTTSADDAAAGRCVIVALRGLPGDDGADNAVVILESAPRATQTEHAGAHALAHL